MSFDAFWIQCSTFWVPLSRIIGRSSSFGLSILSNGQHISLPPPEHKNESIIYFETSPGIGFFMLENNWLIWLHRFTGTQNEAFPVGIWHGLSLSVPSLSEGITKPWPFEGWMLLRYKWIKIKMCDVRYRELEICRVETILELLYQCKFVLFICGSLSFTLSSLPLDSGVTYHINIIKNYI